MRFPALLLLLPLLLTGQSTTVFSDEFNGNELDLARWSPHAANASATNASLPSVSGGQLHLLPGQTITSFGLFSQLYGRFEIRFRASAGSSFRLQPVPFAPLPAIDVFSIPGDPRKISFANYWGTEQTERSFGDSFDLASAPFHIVTMEWGPSSIAWFVDGKERFRSTGGIPTQPMFLSLETAGDGAFDVDYIRVYRGR